MAGLDCGKALGLGMSHFRQELALRGLMVDQNSFDEPAEVSLSRLLSRTKGGIEKRQTRITELEAEASILKAEAKRLRQAQAALAALQDARSKGHWCEVVRQVDRAKDLGGILNQFSEGTSAEIGQVRETAVKRADESLSDLSSTLPSALDAEGLTPDPSSRFPVFKLRNGFFEVKINKPKYEAQIIVRHGNIVKVSADLSIIVDAVAGENARCFGSPPDLVGFSARLRAAYALLMGADRPRPLPLEDVRLAIAEPVPPRDEFAVALAGVLRDQPVEADGMNLDHTKSIDSGFLLPGFEDRGYYGHINFASL